MLNGIRQCAGCSMTVEDRMGIRYEWATGVVHDCREVKRRWMNAVADEALQGNELAARNLGFFVGEWLAS